MEAMKIVMNGCASLYGTISMNILAKDKNGEENQVIYLSDLLKQSWNWDVLERKEESKNEKKKRKS